MEGEGGRPRPGEILARVNHELCVDNDTMMFVTLFLAMLNASTGELWFCNAGHDSPFWLRDCGIDRLWGTRSMALGVMPDAAYASDRAELEAGETLYVFTDGITEATGADGEMFTEAAIVSVLQKHAKAPLEEMVRAVTDALSAFVGDELPFDDVTALAVRREA
jgi:phosphoserine phosphatase RsbU/P